MQSDEDPFDALALPRGSGLGSLDQSEPLEALPQLGIAEGGPCHGPCGVSSSALAPSVSAFASSASVAASISAERDAGIASPKEGSDEEDYARLFLEQLRARLVPSSGSGGSI